MPGANCRKKCAGLAIRFEEHCEGRPGTRVNLVSVGGSYSAVMETTHKPGNLPCSDVRELLSDLIDARRGEIPHPDGTRLTEPGMRAAVELHVAACEACREELYSLQEIGAAFS